MEIKIITKRVYDIDCIEFCAELVGVPDKSVSAFGGTPLKAVSELCIALKAVIDVDIKDGFFDWTY
jgi:hypothetical protein